MGKEELQIYSLEEIAQHNTEDSTWIVMDDKVYDVTKFLAEHPGGSEVIVDLAGQDATDGFNDVGHSSDARQMAEDYVIGRLPPAETPKKPEENKVDIAEDSVKGILLSPTWTNFIIPAAISIGIYVVYKAAYRLLL